MKRHQLVQTLWSDYGEILRFHLDGCEHDSVIVKTIREPDKKAHPRGWNTEAGNQRKLHSYQVEHHWYKEWVHQCDSNSKVAEFYGGYDDGNLRLVVMEDLDASGYACRSEGFNEAGLKACVRWLAEFHACFLGKEPQGLWPIGTYWHLATRQDELHKMQSGALRDHAEEIDRRLNTARYQTIVHGDAKLANFCFSDSYKQVAAVDFQYIGGGVGVKDLAYFLGSCLSNDELFNLELMCLDEYFMCLTQAIKRRNISVDIDALKRDWSTLYSFSVADFARFLEGWQPGHRKLNAYTQYHVDKALSLI